MCDFRIEIFVSIRMQGKRTKKPTPYPEFIRTTANAYLLNTSKCASNDHQK